MRIVYRALFELACLLGRPIGGIRPRRIYDILGRRAFTAKTFAWRQNKWGDALLLSPYYDIDRQIIAFGTYDPDLHALIEQIVQPGMVCLDVGANLGEVTLHLARRVRPAGKVYAFEPAEPAFQRLKTHVEKNAALDVVSLQPLALADTAGASAIALADAEHRNQGLATLAAAPAGLNLRQTVATATLDQFADQEKLARLDLIKIDIQGAELRFLKGAARTLDRFGPDLLIEISPGDLRAAGADSRQLCEQLAALGYALHRIAGGVVGARLAVADLRADFHATNIFCTKKPNA